MSTTLAIATLGVAAVAEASFDPGNGNGKGQGTSESAKDNGTGQAKSNGNGQAKDNGNGQAKDNGTGQAKSNGTGQAKSNGTGQAKDNGTGQAKDNGTGQAKDNGNGQAKSNGQAKDQGQQEQAPATSGGKSGSKGGKAKDPAGNNGTVKITPHGEADGIPQNTPHVGCVFDVEWYGFDKGDHIISTVVFQAWSPTKVPMTVDGPSRVFVGGDPASGAGTATGFDGEATYALDFDGSPHPQQGFHVKLTIHTPGSQGADTKHKVFWVQECEEEEPSEAPTTPGDDETTPGDDETTPGDDETTPGDDETTPGDDETTPSEGETEVEGEQTRTPGAGPRGDDTEVKGAQGQVSLPTAVDAGVVTLKWVASPLPLLAVLVGALFLGLGLMARRRAG